MCQASSRRPFFLSFLSLMSLMGAVSSPAEEPPSFQEMVRGIVASRSTIKSYVVTISTKVTDPALPARLTNGEISAPTTRLLAYQLDLVVTASDNCMLIARQEEREDIASKQRQTSAWDIYATTPLGRLRAENGMAYLVEDPLQKVDKPSYFDPLGLGIGFPGEYVNGTSWRVTTDNVLKWPGSFTREKRDSVVRYASDDLILDVDLERGYWPLRQNVAIGSQRGQHFSVETELVKVANCWLPERVIVMRPASTDGVEFQHRLDWKSVNEPIDKFLELEAVQQKYGLTNIRSSGPKGLAD